MLIKTTLLSLSLVAVSAPMAFAKAHDQGKGSLLTVTQTVTAAQGLGAALGKGPR